MTADTAIRPVILAGGLGTRLWPLSRPECAKQFLRIGGRPSTFQATLARAARLGKGLVIAAEANEAVVRKEADELGWSGELILEPHSRDTGPAMAIAALTAAQSHPDSLLLAMPADHVIADDGAFLAAVDRGIAAARAGSLVLFGAKAEAPETGFGYVRCAADAGDGPLPVAEFVEKPDGVRAAELIAEGALWNCGMFLASPATLIGLFEELAPDLLAAAQSALAGSRCDQNARFLDAQALSLARRISFDHAVVVRASNLAVVPTAMGWRDIGTWEAVANWLGTDGGGNCLGEGAVAIETGNCIVHADGLRPVLVGVSDLVVVAANGQLLVMARDRVASLKSVLEEVGGDKI